MTTDAYLKTNHVWQKIETLMDKESPGLHASVKELLNAVKDEREKTSQEIASLKQECMIKAFYIKQLEKLKSVNNSQGVERVENDLINIMNLMTDTLARVTDLRMNP